MKRMLVLCIPLMALAAAPSLAQTTADPQLSAAITQIKAIDNHAHPLKVVREGEPADHDYDALPLEDIEAFPLPLRLQLDNPEFITAWRELYGYKYADMTEPHTHELLAMKQRVISAQGDAYPNWILDQLNIETMFANRVALGRGLAAPRFRWVSFVDALIFPLSNDAAKRANPDYRGFYPGEERLLKRYLADLKISNLPEKFDDYLKQVITATLEKQKREGVIAVKFEAAYLRKLDFDEAEESRARDTYERYAKGGEPPPADYKNLQDFFFRYVAREAGRLGLPVHIHVLDGAGSYYRPSGSNPLLLESVFNDPTLRKTNFVFVHGGAPFTKNVTSLMGKPNVYADFSAQTFFLYPRALSENLRNWLESYPDRVLFGTDCFSFGPAVDWGEIAWLSNSTSRKALALALTGMMNDGEITRERALQLARMVLRENAIKLYSLDKK
ncbi:MAG TPA: amidohydrolase family protein [Pyrinomonadaceae bacterium]|nr:amidohydrolase family protein [Pyrinomonadaceae bacterium]